MCKILSKLYVAYAANIIPHLVQLISEVTSKYFKRSFMRYNYYDIKLRWFIRKQFREKFA